MIKAKDQIGGLSSHPNNRHLIFGSSRNFYIWDFIEKKLDYSGNDQLFIDFTNI